MDRTTRVTGTRGLSCVRLAYQLTSLLGGMERRPNYHSPPEFVHKIESAA